MDELVIFKFSGDMADKATLPAYAAATSIAGLSRSILIPALYLEDQKVHQRNVTNSRMFQLNLLTQRKGSFETVLQFLADPFVVGTIGAVGVALTSDFIRDFIYSVINRTVGNKASERFEELEASGKLNVGDMGALTDAIEPALRDAHKIVGNGASQIFIISGDNNSVVLNSGTKRFLNTSIDDDTLHEKDVSLSSFNANTGNGRVFDYEIGKTVAFQLADEIDARSINTLIESMRCYTRKRRLGDEISSRIAVKYSGIYGPEGRLKKMIIQEARSAKD